MAGKACIASLAAALIFCAAAAAGAEHTPVYILNGYSFGKMPGVNTAELEAKLPQKAGARITRADVVADKDILARELKARHIEGMLFATIAERNGRVWIIFDLQHPERYLPSPGDKPRHFETQNFEGTAHVSPATLAASTDFKKGDTISPEKMNAARQAILKAYAKAMPGKTVTLKAKMRTRPDGAVMLTWIVGEPK